jgi:hypothetical protein
MTIAAAHRAKSDRDAEVGALEQDEEVNERARHRRIAVAAYYRAESRGFAPGREIEDWLVAEREIDRNQA